MQLSIILKSVDKRENKLLIFMEIWDFITRYACFAFRNTSDYMGCFNLTTSALWQQGGIYQLIRASSNAPHPNIGFRP